MLSVRLWWNMHKWSSLVATLFLLILALTGLPLIFSDELAAPPAPRLDHAREPRASLSLESLVRSIKDRYPSEVVQFLFWDAEQPRLVGVGLGSSAEASLDDVRRLMVDESSGEVVTTTPPESGLMPLLLALHQNLCLGPVGSILLGGAALAFLVSLVSGATLYGPFMRRLDFGVIRTGRRRRLKWLDVHNLVGIVTTTWAVVVGATGLINTLESTLFGAWQADLMPRLLSQYPDQTMPERSAPLDVVLASARRALPEMTVTSMAFPGTQFSTPRHYLIWTHGSTVVTSRLFTPVLIDAERGSVSFAQGLPWYLRGLELARPLHFGDYAGLPFKILWACLDLLLIAVLGSGVYLWLARRGFTLPAERDGAELVPE
jgi:uncharacterized iron-regulated membrane protein